MVTRKENFSCDYALIRMKIYFYSIYFIITGFSTSDKQVSENQKIKSIYKIKLNYTVCKLFKNYRK